MTPVETALLGFLIGVLTMFIWASSCYSRGREEGRIEASNEWMATAFDPNKHVQYAGKWFFAVEMASEMPDVEIQTDAGEYPEFPAF